MTDKKGRNEVMVGTFVILGFILLAFVVFFVSGVYLFRSGYNVNVMYGYVSILDKGAPVRMAGVRVGEVSRVDLIYDPVSTKTRVQVKLFIEKGVEIRENYQFKIQGTHVLSEPHIEITPIPGNFPIIKPEAKIEGVQPVEVEAIMEHAEHIAAQLEKIMNGVGAAFDGPEGTQNFSEMLKHLASITKSLDIVLSGSEQDMKSTIQNIQSSTDSLNKILEKMDKGEGTAGKLLSSDELYQELRAFVAEIKAHPWRLMKKDNGGGKFLGIF